MSTATRQVICFVLSSQIKIDLSNLLNYAIVESCKTNLNNILLTRSSSSSVCQKVSVREVISDRGNKSGSEQKNTITTLQSHWLYVFLSVIRHSHKCAACVMTMCVLRYERSSYYNSMYLITLKIESAVPQSDYITDGLRRDNSLNQTNPFRLRVNIIYQLRTIGHDTMMYISFQKSDDCQRQTTTTLAHLRK